MKQETQKNSCSTKGIVLTVSLSLLPSSLFPFSKGCQIGRLRVAEALIFFFQNAFQHDSRLSRTITLWAGNNIERGIEKGGKSTGTRCATGTIRSCRHPSGLIMHRGQPKGNLAGVVKTVVLYIHRRTRETRDPTYVEICTGGISM